MNKEGPKNRWHPNMFWHISSHLKKTIDPNGMVNNGGDMTNQYENMRQSEAITCDNKVRSIL